jgi:hypothetical protein
MSHQQGEGKAGFYDRRGKRPFLEKFSEAVKNKKLTAEARRRRDFAEKT